MTKTPYFSLLIVFLSLSLIPTYSFNNVWIKYTSPSFQQVDKVTRLSRRRQGGIYRPIPLNNDDDSSEVSDLGPVSFPGNDTLAEGTEGEGGRNDDETLAYEVDIWKELMLEEPEETRWTRGISKKPRVKVLER